MVVVRRAVLRGQCHGPAARVMGVRGVGGAVAGRGRFGCPGSVLCITGVIGGYPYRFLGGCVGFVFLGAFDLLSLFGYSWVVIGVLGFFMLVLSCLVLDVGIQFFFTLSAV